VSWAACRSLQTTFGTTPASATPPLLESDGFTTISVIAWVGSTRVPAAGFWPWTIQFVGLTTTRFWPVPSVGVSFVTVAELVKGAVAGGWGLRKWTMIADWLRDVVILPYDFQVSTKWGQLAGAALRRGRPQPVNDMWTAAVSLANGLPLATRNVKDFQAFVDHHGLVLIPH
jgi:predicted nucleic acid-binding protein